MYLLDELFKLLSSPVWGGIGVFASTLLSVIALILARKSSSNPKLLDSPSNQKTLPSSTGTPQTKRSKNSRKNRYWSDLYDPTGGVPDMFLPPSYWND